MLPDTLVARALERAGARFGDPARQEEYLLHQYPGDVGADGLPTAGAKRLGSTQSGCLLFPRGLMAADEVDGGLLFQGKRQDVLRAPYDSPLCGQVETLLWELGRAHQLLATQIYRGTDLPDLRPADLVVIGNLGSPPKDPVERARWEAEWGGVAHGVFVTECRGRTLLSVDGGQRDEGNGNRPTAIHRRERELVLRANGWWLKGPNGWRRLNWRFRCGDMPLRSAA